ncbi:MAG: hypothetical protein N2D54_00365 [Chloroflexota bacterium]
MYKFLLTFHSVLRWIVVLLAVLALINAIRGWRTNADWRDTDRKTGLFYTISLDTQFLLGILLFVVFSPITTAAFSNIGAAMQNAVSRFFLVEHTFYMILAIIFGHIGSAFTKKDIPVKDKFKGMSIYYGLSVLAIILGMPWDRL